MSHCYPQASSATAGTTPLAASVRMDAGRTGRVARERLVAALHENVNPADDINYCTTSAIRGFRNTPHELPRTLESLLSTQLPDLLVRLHARER